MTTMQQLGATALSAVPRREPVRLPEHTPMGEVVAQMHQQRRGAVIIEDEAGCLEGILTERDLLKRLSYADDSWKAIPLREVMTTSPLTVLVSDSISAALSLMRTGSFRHLPVLDTEGRTVGIVSIRDLLTHLAEFFPQEFVNLPPDPDHATSKLYGG